MAFDGITVAAVTKECISLLKGGYISKITQPEKDELQLVVKNPQADVSSPLHSPGGQYKLLMSVDGGLPLLYITDVSKQSPASPPTFCMLLRKHLQGGRIMDIKQPGLERIVEFHIEHRDEMGDITTRKLIIELMGKHSNIILCDQDNKIIDAIKRIPAFISSVREVLPGRSYFVPETLSKLDPLEYYRGSMACVMFTDILRSKPMPVSKALYQTFSGISPLFANELVWEAGIDGDIPASDLSSGDMDALHMSFRKAMEAVETGSFSPNIVYKDGNPLEYAALPLRVYQYPATEYASISSLFITYYSEKAVITRIRQRSQDLRKIVATALERDIKKIDLQYLQLKDTEKMSKYRTWGELLHTYGYQVQPGDKSLTVNDYNTGEDVTIPLDPTKTAFENAKKYFDKYGKLKRTREALEKLTLEVQAEIDHLESIRNSLDIAKKEEDLVPIRRELIESGFIKGSKDAKKVKITSRPMHYISSDGFDIFVGKNNYQNEELTFKIADGSDWWFHAKKLPGSHVILKKNGREIPDRAFEEAAALAGHYSGGREQEKVEVDYVERRFVKKVSGAAPGYVIYHTNYSMAISPDISKLREES